MLLSFGTLSTLWAWNLPSCLLHHFRMNIHPNFIHFLGGLCSTIWDLELLQTPNQVIHNASTTLLSTKSNYMLGSIEGDDLSMRSFNILDSISKSLFFITSFHVLNSNAMGLVGYYSIFHLCCLLKQPRVLLALIQFEMRPLGWISYCKRVPNSHLSFTFTIFKN